MPSPDELERAPALDFYKEVRRHAPALIGIVRGHPLIGSGRAALTSEHPLPRPGRRTALWSRFYRLVRPLELAGRGLQ